MFYIKVQLDTLDIQRNKKTVFQNFIHYLINKYL